MLMSLRSFFAIIEEGSLNRAAFRLHQSQSSLTRQIKILEDEVGGPLFERTYFGVQLTAAGHAMADAMRPVLAGYDRGIVEVSRLLKHGERKTLRIGYLSAAAHAYLDPALGILRRAHPEVQIKFYDLTPGEQIDLLRRGEIDVALAGQEGRIASREFYERKLATLSWVAVLPADHPLATRESLRLEELREERFVRTPEHHLPGRNQWLTQLCQKAGFRVRFGPVSDSLGMTFSLVASEGLVCLAPAYVRGHPAGGVKIVTLAKPAVHWDMVVLWQRGRAAGPLRALLDALANPAGEG